jgi:N-acyl-D-amino-acid deacylase
VSEGGADKMIERLKAPIKRALAKKEMDEPSTTWENQWRGSGGGDGVQLVQVLNGELQKYEGMTFGEIGRQMSKDPKDAAIDVAIADHGKSVPPRVEW